MNIERKPPTIKGPPDQFTGDVYFDPLAAPKDGEDQRMQVSLVRFTPGARTAWHAHGRGQTLHITQGVALIGTRDGRVIRATPGQTIHTPPGEDHWHGATPDDFMEHLAMYETPDGSDARHGWFEHVTDQDYRSATEIWVVLSEGPARVQVATLPLVASSVGRGVTGISTPSNKG